MGSRTLLAVVLFAIVCGTVHSQVTKPTVQLDNPHRHLPTPPRELFLPYWTLEPGWHSELQLRNNAARKDVAVTPVLRTTSGTEVSLPKVKLTPDQTLTIDLAQSVAAVSPQLVGSTGSYGSLLLRYDAVSAKNLFASIMVHRVGHPISFHLDAEEAKANPSGTWEGIWWEPTDTAESFVVISNTTSHPISVTTALSSPGGASQSFQTSLDAEQTIRIDLGAAIAKAGFTERFGGLQVRFVGGAGQVLQFSYDEQIGFSKLMKVFYRYPATQPAEQFTTRAPMVALSNPDPSLQFPDGTKLKSQIVVKNASKAQMPVTVDLNWRSATATGTASVPFSPLQPAETRMLDLSALQDSGVIPSSASWAVVGLTYAGQQKDLNRGGSQLRR